MNVLFLWFAAAACAEPLDVTLHARARRPGEAAVVLVKGHHVKRPPAGRLLGRPLHFFPVARGRWAALAGFDLEDSSGPAKLSLKLRRPDGRLHLWDSDVIVSHRKFPEQRLKVDGGYVDLSPENEDRAERESTDLRELFATVGERRYFGARFRSPIAGAPSSRFGERRFFNDQPRAPHTGADLRAKIGTPIRAPAGGRVAFAGELFFAGKAVVLDHGWGLFTFYGHLSEILAPQGSEVAAGAVFARVGETGRATGPHLHWSARMGGARIDPYSLTALRFGDLLRGAGRP